VNENRKMESDRDVLVGLQKMKLTGEEEENIALSQEGRVAVLEDCSLSLFGKFLSTKSFNRRAARETMKRVWKMNSECKILEVGMDILQFKFNTGFQLNWVVENGPWSFENNLLLLRRWEKGLSTRNLSFTHTPFWIQIWGLPFDLVSEQTGEIIGGRIGKYISGDDHKGPSDQAKFLRIKVEVQVDKPLRRGGYVSSPEGGKAWVDYRYERLPTFCYCCGKLGHDDRDCTSPEEMVTNGCTNYGEWLRATFGAKEAGMGRSGVKGRRVVREVNPVEETKVAPQPDLGGSPEARVDQDEVGENLQLKVRDSIEKSDLVIEKTQSETQKDEVTECRIQGQKVLAECFTFSGKGKSTLEEGRSEHATSGSGTLGDEVSLVGERSDVPGTIMSEEGFCIYPKEKIEMGGWKLTQETDTETMCEDQVEENAKNQVLQVMQKVEAGAHPKWKRRGKAGIMQNKQESQENKKSMVGVKRERDENRDPNIPLSECNKKACYAPDWDVTDTVLGSARAGNQPRRPQ
jgi:hypothetical protein